MNGSHQILFNESDLMKSLKIKFILAGLFIFALGCTEYSTKIRCYGLDEPIIFSNRFKILRIDTIYSPEGGVKKVVTIKGPVGEKDYSNGSGGFGW